jgi:hypothetical protein
MALGSHCKRGHNAGHLRRLAQPIRVQGAGVHNRGSTEARKCRQGCTDGWSRVHHVIPSRPDAVARLTSGNRAHVSKPGLHVRKWAVHTHGLGKCVHLAQGDHRERR